MTSTTPASTPVSPSAKGAAKTEYVILSREGNAGPWTEDSSHVEASSADAAIRVLLRHVKAGDGMDARQWIAVPVRSWQPRKVRVETSTKVTLG